MYECNKQDREENYGYAVAQGLPRHVQKPSTLPMIVELTISRWMLMSESSEISGLGWQGFRYSRLRVGTNLAHNW